MQFPLLKTINFATALADKTNLKAFAKDCDSGDHLHPSYHGYELMAKEALKMIKKELI